MLVLNKIVTFQNGLAPNQYDPGLQRNGHLLGHQSADSSGEYRIRHSGEYKYILGGKYPYEGLTHSFTVKED